ncbi:MAG: UTP--glucose-1-phosphate uridylyltransferase GalU [Gammaproteobacteria bacterium]|nr:UTP--glucose-1-phosphate uridylyltransferase GalU [Gammaproteobacteria bacterium]
MKIKKAIFPVAGLGTRFLPATKASPKEMMPVVDKPLIQYAVEEAIRAGMTELIFVTSGMKRAIEDHFDQNFELEYKLKQQEKWALLEAVQGIIPSGVSCVYVRQKEALGLGHAVLCARDIVGDEPFAVLLADDLIDGPGLSEMIDQMPQKEASGMIAVEEVDPQQTNQYGIVTLGPDLRIENIVEKPKPEEALSHLGVVGRYILPAAIFDILQAMPSGRGGEIQLTDGISRLLVQHPIYAHRFSGVRYDCGAKLGYLKANLMLGLQHPECGQEWRHYLKGLIL